MAIFALGTDDDSVALLRSCCSTSLPVGEGPMRVNPRSADLLSVGCDALTGFERGYGAKVGHG